MKNSACFIFVIGFLICIGVPPVVMGFKWGQPINLEENRTAAPLPQWPRHLQEIKNFCTQSENYINDHFGFRSYLVKMSRAFILSVLKTSTSSSVMIGQEGWLFFRGDKSIESYRNIEPLDSKKIEAWKTFFNNFKERAAGLGMHLVILIPPASTTIYPQYLPSYVNKIGKTSALQTIHQILKDLDLRFADPAPLLIEQSKHQPVFFKSDTHWNSLGAYFGYTALLHKIQEAYPDLTILPFSSYELTDGPLTNCNVGNCDLAVMLGWPAHYAQQLIELKSRRKSYAKLNKAEGAFQGSILEYTNDKSAPYKLLAYRDSFFTHLIPFVSEQFSESIYIWRRDISWKLIAEYKPNIIVFEIAERFLAFDPPQHLD